MVDLNIPKILHLYWGRNKKLSYMKYLTVKSFSILNPDWKIKVYCSNEISLAESWGSKEQKSYEYQGEDCFADLSGIANTDVVEFDFSIFNIGELCSEVHKSDILRLYILSTEGGVWSDFDILYLKSMDELHIKSIGPGENACFCFSGGYHSIGFLMSTPNSMVFSYLLGIALEESKNKELEYQSLGSNLFLHFFHHNKLKFGEFNERCESNILNIPFVAIYPFAWSQADSLFEKIQYQFMEKTIGVHWYAGANSTSKYENIVTKDNIKESEDIFLLKLMGEICE